MRLSSKGRYALATMVVLAERYPSGENSTALQVSEMLGISKIYLEQVFSLLRKAALVVSAKGSQGGYTLSREPRDMTAWDILSASELLLIEGTEAVSPNKEPAIEEALFSSVFHPLDAAVAGFLRSVTLADLVEKVQSNRQSGGLMFYI